MTRIEQQVHDVVSRTPEPDGIPEWANVVRRGRAVTRRRRVGHSLVALSVAAAVVVVLVASQSSQSANRSIVANPGPDQATSAPAPTFSPDQVDALLTPITPDDLLNDTRNLLDFQGRVNLTLLQQCVATKGYPGSMGSGVGPTIADDHATMVYFDSPAVMRQYGFGVATGTIAPSPASLTPPPTAVARACHDELDQTTARLTSIVNLYSDWTTQIGKLEYSDPVAPAWRAWAACMHDAGYDVASDIEFRGVVKDAMKAAGASEAAVEIELGTIDANCLEPTVVAARTQARIPARPQYIADHADEFRAAETELSSVIQELSDTTGVPYAATPAEPATPTTSPTTTTAAPAIERQSCIVRSPSEPGCDATPAQAAPLLGAHPHSPAQIPSGWGLARQRLRLLEIPNGDNGALYLQTWVPDGAQANADGYYPKSIGLQQRPTQPNESEPHLCRAPGHSLSNGSQACYHDTVIAPGSTAHAFQAEWIHDGIWYVLIGNSITNAQFEATLNSID